MPNLILIGPKDVGKSTVAHWIARDRNAPLVSLDDTSQPWHRDNQPVFANVKRTDLSIAQRRTHAKHAEAISVKEALAGIDNTVVDFGAGHSVFVDGEHFEMVRAALLGHHVVLLLPSINLEVSRSSLYERSGYNVESCDLADFV